MLSHRDRQQNVFFVAGSLRDLIPDDHILAWVDSVLDLSWPRGKVSDCYDLEESRPRINPEVAVRLMLTVCPMGAKPRPGTRMGDDGRYSPGSAARFVARPDPGLAEGGGNQMETPGKGLFTAFAPSNRP